MDRADGARLDPRAHARSYIAAVRYADLDTQGHVNNIALATIIEDARSQFLIDAGVTIIQRGGATETLGGGRLVTAAAHYEYLAQAFYPGTIETWCATIRIGRTSLFATQLALQNGIAVGVCMTAFTLTDGERPIPIGPEIRHALSKTMLAESNFAQ